MNKETVFDVIIIGGSYAGLSAALALGRALRTVLVLDSGLPCNRQTLHSHNFLTQDGATPKAIFDKAKSEVLAYEKVNFVAIKATKGEKQGDFFKIETNTELVPSEREGVFFGKKLLFATGVFDIMPDIKGYAECWGISVLHCPFCHGYEIQGSEMGILANGDMAVDMTKLIHNWTPKLTLFTNGKSTLTLEQTQKITSKGIKIVEKEVDFIEHEQGQIQKVWFKDGSNKVLKAVFARPDFIQHCTIPTDLGCELTEMGHIKTDNFTKTNIAGIYAAGDCTSPLRAVSNAVAAGTMAGAMLSRELIDDNF